MTLLADLTPIYGNEIPVHLVILQAQRAELVSARASGELRVVFHSGGTRREVEYRSVSDIEKAIAAIDREIASRAGRRVHTFLPTFSKGL